MYTYFEKYLGVLPKKNEGEKIKYKQTVDCHVRKYCHKENRSAKKITYTYMYIREHKAYTYLRIYTLKQNKTHA